MIFPRTADQLINDVLNSLKPNTTIADLISVKDSCFIVDDTKISLNAINHIFAVGKAASQQAKAMKDFFILHNLEEKLGKVFAYTKRDHSVEDENISQIEGDHPFLSNDNLKNTEKFLSEITKLPNEDRVFVLISGGASSLLELPKEGIDFELQQKIYKDLVLGGKDIRFINSVRKAMSQTKNGGLLKAIPCKDITCFVTSDIPGDHLQDVGSGPMHPVSLDFSKVNEFLKTYGIQLAEEEMLLVEPQSFLFQSASRCCEYLKERHSNLKVGPVCDADFEEVLNQHLDLVPENSEILVTTGEAALQVNENPGRGGRNTHFVLALAERLYKDPNYRDLHIISMGTDGTDGPTDAAGAYINFDLYQKNLDAKKYLRNYDSYTYFEKAGSLIKTGPTGTNIMDVRFCWREKD